MDGTEVPRLLNGSWIRRKKGPFRIMKIDVKRKAFQRYRSTRDRLGGSQSNLSADDESASMHPLSHDTPRFLQGHGRYSATRT